MSDVLHSTTDPTALARFGSEIRSAREARGWTRAHFAERCGISLSTIKNLETGRGAHPRLETMIRLAEGLDVALAELVACVDPRGPQSRTTPPEAIWLDALDEDCRALVLALVRVLLRKPLMGAADTPRGLTASQRDWYARSGQRYLS